MRSRDAPADAALMTGRKRSIHDLEAAAAARAAASAGKRATPDHLRVDRDLLIQVLRVQLTAMIRDLRAQVADDQGEDEQGPGGDARFLLRAMEDLVGHLAQDWVLALLAPDKPQYGFPEVLAALKARLQAARGGRGDGA